MSSNKDLGYCSNSSQDENIEAIEKTVTFIQSNLMTEQELQVCQLLVDFKFSRTQGNSTTSEENQPETAQNIKINRLPPKKRKLVYESSNKTLAISDSDEDVPPPSPHPPKRRKTQRHGVVTTAKGFRCVCGSKYPDEIELESHIIMEKYGAVFYCNHCTILFTSPSDAKVHMREAHSPLPVPQPRHLSNPGERSDDNCTNVPSKRTPQPKRKPTVPQSRVPAVSTRMQTRKMTRESTSPSKPSKRIWRGGYCFVISSTPPSTPLPKAQSEETKIQLHAKDKTHTEKGFKCICGVFRNKQRLLNVHLDNKNKPIKVVETEY